MPKNAPFHDLIFSTLQNLTKILSVLFNCSFITPTTVNCQI